MACGSGLTIGFAWAALAAMGRWKPPRDWIDAAGRLLGACWIAASVASLL